MNYLLAAGSVGGGPYIAGEGPNVANMTLLGVYLALAIGVSFLCSLLEAGLLSVPTSHVELMAKENRRGGQRLKHMKTHVDRPLAAILTLNTVAHTIGAAGVGAQVLVIWGSGAVAIGSAVVTLLILVFSEIIPKSIGAAQAKPLAAFTAYAIQGMIWLTLPLLIPLQWISSRLGGGHAIKITRDEVAITAELGHSAGEIDPDESRVIRNVLRLRQITVRDIMTPRPVVFMLNRTQTSGQVMEENGRLSYSRIPVHDGNPDNIVGHVTRRAILQSVADDQHDQPLEQLLKPLDVTLEDATVAATLNRLIANEQHIILVEDEFGGTSGLVTLEDCVETLLGVEIVDETDATADLRQAARELLERRRSEHR
ncbi:hemolysin family protein [Algisphaera agarilytica]|uniref:CBS domain containing-hemolysin-like protein n=1 Tax=Algisphaera agarilytica TaxID=1385975 RepID=A0A7X0H897_9BACT|nr:hemolysin family protein [Algisphaera agarilytica]MBB6429639.1 CBS domain containing-hemolysin-like protein [Algisphaera agarilytica]